MLNKRFWKLMSLITLVCVGLITSVSLVEAQGNVSITNYSCEAITHNGQDEAHFQFDVTYSNMRNQNVIVGVWPRYVATDDDIMNVTTSSDYEDRDGYIVTTLQVRPTSSYISYTDDMYIPVSVFPSGNYDFYGLVEIHDAYGNDLGDYYGTECPLTVSSGGRTVPPTPTPVYYNDSELNPYADPTFGAVNLTSGFLADPYRVAVITGGNVDISSFLTGDACLGFAASAPDFNLTWNGSSRYMRIYFDSSEDTTMVVNAPNGDWYCDDDDGPGTDPQVSFSYPDTGTYNIWIGDFGSNTTSGYLYVSELSN